MKNLISQFVIEISQNPKSAAAVHASTLGAWVVSFLDLISNNLGNIALIIGSIGSLVVIYTNLMQHRIKMKILRKDLDEREARNGTRSRRDD